MLYESPERVHRQSRVPAATNIHTAVREHEYDEPVLLYASSVHTAVRSFLLRSVPVSLDRQEVLASRTALRLGQHTASVLHMPQTARPTHTGNSWLHSSLLLFYHYLFLFYS